MRNRSRKPRAEAPVKKDEEFLPTGSTMLNLSISDSIQGGWPLGKIITIPGQSAAGKTLLALSAFAEASINSRFDDYELIYDDIERRNDFDLAKLFGPDMVNRLRTPGDLLYSELANIGVDDTGISNTIQDLRDKLLLLKKANKKYIYVVDSLDSLSTDEELEKELKRALANAKDSETVKKIAGSFNTEKSRVLGQILRSINTEIANTDSLLIITQQLRARINAMPGQEKWVTSGGKAPEYYSHVRPYMAKSGTIKDKTKKYRLGVHTRIVMQKNSVTGKYRNVEFDIYNDLGIDDVSSIVSYLIQEKHWKMNGGWITADDLSLREQGKDKMVRAIEDKGLEVKLHKIAQRKWRQVEKSLELGRKPRYSK